MRIFIILCYGLTVASADLSGYNYEPVYQNFPSNQQPNQLHTIPAAKETEFFTYSAPENYHDSKEINRLAGLISPQRVVFIKNPEKNIFSITAEQLAKQQSLSIYVLNRQTNSAALLSQLQEIRERVGQKPNVQFVKYRTAEDIERAKQAIYNDLDTIPGTTKYQEDRQTSVVDFDSKSHQFYSAKEEVTTYRPPVIFDIKRRSTPSPLSSIKWQQPSLPSIERSTPSPLSPIEWQQPSLPSIELQEYLPPKLN